MLIQLTLSSEEDVHPGDNADSVLDTEFKVNPGEPDGDTK